MADSCRACLSSMVLRDNADEALLGRDGAFALFFRRFFSCTARSISGGAEPTVSMASFAARSRARVDDELFEASATVNKSPTVFVFVCECGPNTDTRCCDGIPCCCCTGEDGAEMVTVVGIRVASAASTAALAAASTASMGTMLSGPADEMDMDLSLIHI